MTFKEVDTARTKMSNQQNQTKEEHNISFTVNKDKYMSPPSTAIMGSINLLNIIKIQNLSFFSFLNLAKEDMELLRQPFCLL